MPTLTRDELYTLVWTEPIQKLAPRYGLSDRGLGKLCARHHIPVPPRGWWARKAAGKRVAQPKLPPLADPYRQHIRLHDKRETASNEVPKPEVHALVAFEMLKENGIAVPEGVELTHRSVVKTQKRLTRSKRDALGLVAAPPGVLHVHTSRAQHDRALRILQALLAAFESRGFAVAASHAGVAVTVLDESLVFGIEEQTKQIAHAITFTEQKVIDRGWGPRVLKWDHVPSGTLALVITNVHAIRHRWSERLGRPLEGMLNRFLIGLVRAALALKRQQADAERRERERQEEEQRRAEAERRRKAEGLRNREEIAARKRFDQVMEWWRENEQRRVFLAELRRTIGEVATDSPLDEWLAWAERYTELADPLSRFRDRGTVLKLYYSGYRHQLEEIRQNGFVEPEDSAGYGQEPPPPGVLLRDQQVSDEWGSELLELEIPEDLVLPYEVTQPGFIRRKFYVPARVLNELRPGDGPKLPAW